MVSSKANSKEARVVLSLVKQFLQHGEIDAKKIGIISPYSGQVKLIGDMITSSNISKLSVNTVDGFQGREKQVVIVSCVRSNHEGNVGFLSDWRRLNVSITRAIRGLIVIGNEETLKHDKHWSKWIEWAKQKNFVSKYVQDDEMNI